MRIGRARQAFHYNGVSGYVKRVTHGFFLIILPHLPLPSTGVAG